MKLLSLDLSTKSSGWAIFADGDLKDHGCITSSSTDLIKRIHIMADAIDEILQNNEIDKIIVEEVRPEGGYGVGNQKTHKALMYLQGAICMMVHDNYPKVTIDYLYPSEWRKCCKIKTGRGVVRETVKQRDIRFVQETFGLTVNDDIADAIGLGYAHLHPGGEEEMLVWGE